MGQILHDMRKRADPSVKAPPPTWSGPIPEGLNPTDLRSMLGAGFTAAGRPNPFEHKSEDNKTPEAEAFRQKEEANKSLRPDQGQYQAMLKALTEELAKPFDPNDPYNASILKAVQTAAGQESFMSGVQGGLAVSNVTDAVSKAAVGLDMQRKEMAMRAMGMGMQDSQFGEGLAFQGTQRALDREHGMKVMDTQRGWALDDRQWAADQQAKLNEANMWGSLIGGGLGAAASFVPVVGPLIAGPVGAIGKQAAGSMINPPSVSAGQNRMSGLSYGSGSAY